MNPAAGTAPESIRGVLHIVAAGCSGRMPVYIPHRGLSQTGRNLQGERAYAVAGSP
jgi:hypothetical protein